MPTLLMEKPRLGAMRGQVSFSGPCGRGGVGLHMHMQRAGWEGLLLGSRSVCVHTCEYACTCMYIGMGVHACPEPIWVPDSHRPRPPRASDPGAIGSSRKASPHLTPPQFKPPLAQGSEAEINHWPYGWKQYTFPSLLPFLFTKLNQFTKVAHIRFVVIPQR